MHKSRLDGSVQETTIRLYACMGIHLKSGIYEGVHKERARERGERREREREGGGRRERWGDRRGVVKGSLEASDEA